MRRSGGGRVEDMVVRVKKGIFIQFGVQHLAMDGDETLIIPGLQSQKPLSDLFSCLWLHVATDVF